MVNTNEIKAQIRRAGTTQGELARKIGIDPSTLSRKMNKEQGTMISVKEANDIAIALMIPRNQLIDIFFAESVAKKQQ